MGIFPSLKDLYLFWTLHMQGIPIFEILFKIVLYILSNHLSHLYSVGLPAEPDIYFLAWKKIVGVQAICSLINH